MAQLKRNAEPRLESAGLIEDLVPRREPVGHLLARHREQLGQDLRTVSDVLRIRYVYLRAIEEGRYDELPGPTYAVGFVRTYADYLGLDADEIVGGFKEEVSGLEHHTSLVFPVPKPEGRIPGGALILISVLLILVAYGGWYMLSNDGRRLVELLPVPGGGEQGLSAASNETGTPETGAPETGTPQTGTPQTGTPGIGAPDETATEESAQSPETEDAPGESELALAPASEATANAGESTPLETESEPAPATSEPASSEAAPEDSATATAEAEPAVAEEALVQAQADTERVAAARAEAESEPQSPPVVTSAAEPDNAPMAPTGVGTEEDGAVGSSGSTLLAAPPPVPEERMSGESGAAAEPLDQGTGASGTPSDVQVGAIPAPPTASAGAEGGDSRSAKVYGAVAADARIVLRALSDSWVQVRDSEDELLFTQVLRAGDSYRVPNQDGLTLLTGNAGGLEIMVDGARAPAIGPVGDVRRDIPLDPERLLQGTGAATPER